MVQLSLLPQEEVGVRAHVTQLQLEWASKVGSCGHLSVARRATLARFASWEDQPLSATQRERVRAYFSAIVRRRILKSNDSQARGWRRELLKATIEADLREAGWDERRAAEEALRTVNAATKGAA